MEDVVVEAQRIHYHLFSHLFQGFSNAIFINIFTWPNRGDHVITLGQRILLKKFNISLVGYCLFPEKKCHLDNVTSSNDLLVFVQGGGYIGDNGHRLWIQKLIRKFPNSRVIFFPNSFSDTNRLNDVVFKRLFTSHKDLHLMLRDRFSYEVSLPI